MGKVNLKIQKGNVIKRKKRRTIELTEPVKSYIHSWVFMIAFIAKLFVFAYIFVNDNCPVHV